MQRIIIALLFLSASAIASAQATRSFELGPPVPEDLMQSYQPGAAAAATQPGPDEEPKVEASMVEFLSTRFRAHEPIYFLSGPLEPNSKFQFSLKYQLFREHGKVDKLAPWASELYIAYSQTSFWDIGGQSSPFFDSSYRPEFLYQLDSREADWLPGLSRFDLQSGLRHESNGKAGLDSRSLNILYVSPIFTFGDPGDAHLRARRERNGDGHDDFFIAVAPRLWMYLTEMDDNPDIYHYRGYGDVRLVAGWRGGLQAAFTGRVGNEWDKGSLQVDLTYPLQRLAIRDLGMYLHAQLFTGFGESLLDYNESDTTFRMGLSLVR
ncbi:MAG: phospholipase [Phycisphaerales bacterium]|jgi:outer membrane phospholipase A|nr:phospholipase [Phycisphaerales bacterium]